MKNNCHSSAWKWKHISDHPPCVQTLITNTCIWNMGRKIEIKGNWQKSPIWHLRWWRNKANLMDLIAATGLVILLKLDSNHRFFILYDLKLRWMTLTNNRALLLVYINLCALFQSHQSVNSKWSYNPETLNSGQNWWFSVPCDFKIWRMALKINKAPLLCYFKLFASFHSHRSIRAGVTVRKCQIQVKISNFLSRVTLKFDGWPWKTIGHLI